MIDICLMGGLGNQMFEYALYKNFECRGIPAEMFIMNQPEKQSGTTALEAAFPQAEIHWDEDHREYKRLQNQDGRNTIADKVIRRLVFSRRRLVYEKRDGVFDARVPNITDAALIGYWQTSKYWTGIQSILQKIFVFSHEYDGLTKKILKEMGSCESVSIHIRGGDYLTEATRKIFGGICTPSYYQKAVNIIRSQKKNSVFFVFSNDRKYAEEILGRKCEFHFVNELINAEYPDWVDMMLMSRCRHHILANSSFSWWGAYLGNYQEKIIIAPDQWLNGKGTKDIWEPEWIRIGNK